MKTHDMKRKILNSIIYTQEADIAITDLTVTYDRIEAIDFSPSILELGKNCSLKLLYSDIRMVFGSF